MPTLMCFIKEQSHNLDYSRKHTLTCAVWFDTGNHSVTSGLPEVAWRSADHRSRPAVTSQSSSSSAVTRGRVEGEEPGRLSSVWMFVVCEGAAVCVEGDSRRVVHRPSCCNFSPSVPRWSDADPRRLVADRRCETLGPSAVSWCFLPSSSGRSGCWSPPERSSPPPCARSPDSPPLDF